METRPNIRFRLRPLNGSTRQIGLFSWAIFAVVSLLSLSTQAALATNPPVITPGTGVYSSVQATATITGDVGATFNYTTDGTTPTIGSPSYSTPIPLGDTTTIKAIATLSGVSSTVTTANIENDPTTFPVSRTGLALWLKPEFMVISSGKLIQWSDVSGSSPANDATQATSTNQPSQVTNSLYGYQAASFNGTNSFMNLPSFLTNLTNGISIFAVISPNTSSTAKTILTASPSAANTDNMTSLSINSTTVTFNANNGATTGSVVTSSGAVTTSKYQILDVVHTGASATASINVDSVLAPTTGTVQTLTNTARTVAYVGTNNAKTSTAYWGGKIVELLCYSRAVTVTERADIEAYLSNRYQMALATSTPAPVFAIPTGTLSTAQYVAIFAPPNATVVYTTDGSTPVPGTSPVYTGPINIAWTQTVKAIATANNINSSTATATYTLSDTVRWPAPSATTTPLNINLQLPTTAIPQ